MTSDKSEKKPIQIPLHMETDIAWERLQQRLRQDQAEPSPAWAQWHNASHRQANDAAKPNVPMTGSSGPVGMPLNLAASAAAAGIDSPAGRTVSAIASPLPSSSERLSASATGANRSKHPHKRRAKWLGIVAAAVILLTPVGDRALAIILGQFQMSEVMPVDGDELNQLFNSVFPQGEERTNRYGTFYKETGTVFGKYSAAEAEQLLKRKLAIPQFIVDYDSKITIQRSEKFHFVLDVQQINTLLNRVGASKLLPDSVDGQTITLELKEGVSVNTYNDKNADNRYSFTQRPLPVVQVDSGIPLEEAYEALIQFPMLPPSMKQAIQASDYLNNGKVPLPIPVHADSTKQVKVSGQNVWITKEARAEDYYSALWVDDEQIFDLSGQFASEQQVTALITELIGQ